VIDDRLARAGERYERAVFGGDADAVTEAWDELDGVEADLALARGRLLHARFLADRQQDPQELELFTRAADLYERLGDVRGEAQARFWVGVFHQVVRDDGDAALPALRRSHELAVRAGDGLTRSYAARHLGFHAMAAGDLDRAATMLEESLRLRREAGHRPAVAAALLALAELAARRGEPGQAEELLTEAATEAEDSGAAGTMRWIEAVRAELSS